MWVFPDILSSLFVILSANIFNHSNTRASQDNTIFPLFTVQHEEANLLFYLCLFKCSFVSAVLKVYSCSRWLCNLKWSFPKGRSVFWLAYISLSILYLIAAVFLCLWHSSCRDFQSSRSVIRLRVRVPLETTSNS